MSGKQLKPIGKAMNTKKYKWEKGTIDKESENHGGRRKSTGNRVAIKDEYRPQKKIFFWINSISPR